MVANDLVRDVGGACMDATRGRWRRGVGAHSHQREGDHGEHRLVGTRLLGNLLAPDRAHTPSVLGWSCGEAPHPTKHKASIPRLHVGLHQQEVRRKVAVGAARCGCGSSKNNQQQLGWVTSLFTEEERQLRC